MSAREELAGPELAGVKSSWIAAMKEAVAFTKVLLGMGLHKQVANRICEPWQRMKTVVSGTEWANFFHLRNHPDAQPEFHELARVMQIAYDQSRPQILHPGHWHLPYVNTVVDGEGTVTYFTAVGVGALTEEDALKVSAACCAQVSYRRLDDTLEAAKRIFSRLIESDPKHASPVEHQGKVMLNEVSSGSTDEWEPGVTHMRRDGTLWSANFKGWVQARQLIANEAKW
jgi:thymidylate synthase ThyX